MKTFKSSAAILVIAICIVNVAFAQSWSDLGCQVNGGTRTLLIEGNTLYMGGTFTGNVMNHSISQNCNSLGYQGTNSDVRGMVIFNGDLYVAGVPTAPDPGHIYKFSGGNWSSFAVYNGWINTMAVYNGSLYVGGGLSEVNGVQVSNVAKWDGANWTDMDGGIPFTGSFPQVRTMCVYNNQLIVAGDGFGNFANDIASWNGTTWNTLSSGVFGGFNVAIQALKVHNGELYVCGKFDFAGGQACTNIAKWNGATWSALGSGVTGGDTLLLSMASYHGKLYVGGLFSEAGGNPAANIASWNGNVWSEVGGGLPSAAIASMAEYYGSLVVASGMNGLSLYYPVWSDCPAVITAGSSTSFCGGNVTLNASVGSAYQWYRNGQILNGSANSSYVASASGNYFCLITNACGNVISNTITVNASAPPSNASISASGPVTFCNGGSVTLNATIGTGYTYQWRNFSTPIPGATNSSHNVTSSGYFSCIISNACSGISSNNYINVTVNSLPSATISPSGPTTFCALSSVTLNANTGAGLTYKWYKYGNIIPGATAASYVASTAGKYKVEVTNSNGCFKKSAAVTVVVNPLPSASIAASGSTSICAGDSVMLNASTNIPGSTFQWKRYSNIISGATASSYAAKLTGNYKAIVTSPAGCLRVSNGILVNVVCREGNFSDDALAVYPNPVSNILYINSEREKITQLTLLNTIGSEIYRETINSENNVIEIDFSELPSGIYILKVTTESGQKIERILKE